MPETRKFEPSGGDPIAEALRAAMGEPIRPTTPGSKPTASSESQPAEPVRPTIVPLGTYRFTRVANKEQPADEDGDDD